ncbi:MAG: Gfo/Idh/MocA family oxidoreductase [Candidatus Kapaibacterium sp.]
MNNSKIELAIAGAGRWGFNHVKTAYGILGDNLKYVCDVFPAASEKIKGVCENIKFTTDFEDVLRDDEVNAVIIATSAEIHYNLAKKALLAGKNVLVEKPITLLTMEAKELLDIAGKKNLKLMVGHILLFHPAVLKIKEMLDSGKLGKLQYIYSNRLNLGAIRTEENILWSFAPHDISVIQFLTDRNPVSIKASGAKFVQNNIEDTTLTILEYPDNIHAHIYVSWLHPFKEQRLVVIGSEGMLTFEDTLKSEKLKFYKKGFVNNDGTIEKFDSEYEPVAFDNTQPLEEEQKHFFDCILNNEKPRTDGKHALEVLEILEKAQQQLRAVKSR